MALNDLQLKVASEEALFGLQKHMATIKYFAKNFSPAASVPFGSVVVPVYDLSAAADFNSETNNWCGDETIDGTVIPLEKHLIKSVKLDDTVNTTGDINFVRDAARAVTEVLTHGANQYCWGQFTDANISAAAGASIEDLSAAMPSTKAGFAGLFAICDQKGINPYESVLALDPTAYSGLLSCLDYNIIGSDEAIKYGVIEGLYGMRAVVCTSYLPAGTRGVIVPYSSFAVVNRYNAPTVNGYENTWTATDTDGFTLGFRVFEHLCKGAAILGGDVLLGAKVLQKVIPLK